MKYDWLAGPTATPRFFSTIISILVFLISSCVPLDNQNLPGAGTPLPDQTLSPGNAETATQAPLSPSLDEATPTAAPTPYEMEGMYNFPDNVNPLTGLVVDDPSRLERRPVMVKVSNFPRTGRPHAGLSFADFVFEYYIGYGMNRFSAIYLSQDCSQVGPVRSGRLVDAQLGEMYQSLLFYGDADPQVDKVILHELGPRALAEMYLPSPPKYRIGKILTRQLFL